MIFEVNGQNVEIDLLGLDELISNLHELPPVQKLQRICDYLKAYGLEINLSAAWQFWDVAIRLADRWRLKAIHSTEIAFWFGIDPFNLSEEQRLGLKSNLNRVLAQKAIYSGNYDPASMDGVYNLYKLAYDNEDLAQDAKSKAAKRFMEQQTAKKS